LTPTRKIVVIVGGSLGAKSLNDAGRDLAAVWQDRPTRAILQVTGRRSFATYAESTIDQSTPKIEYLRLPFVTDMHKLYEAADVLIARAGASTVAEIQAAGVPSILVPLPNSPGDHQGANARSLVEKDAALLVADPTCTGAFLSRMLDQLFDDPSRLDALGQNAKALSNPHAAFDVAKLVVDHAAP
jgi:UDP-N-acetylglucosamine--N-acetylmuramyl-(pentapeptide) pyrophosphoryl-undecaprenol N-acetylglucosamine transferase